MFKVLFDGLCDLLFPHLCLLCQKHLATSEPKTALCVNCLQSLQRNRPPFCRKCSRPLETGTDFCRGCRRRSFAFDAAWAACVYNEPVRQLIHLYKYNHKTVLRYHFFQILFTFITAYRLPLYQYDWIVPIPLHPARLRERGYNQAQLLAQLLACQYDTKLSVNNLTRVRNTESQSILSQKERWTNIQHAFRIKQPFTFKDKNILLVDDLLTTGATASEAAGTLKAAGAKRVDVLTLAVTGSEDHQEP